MSRLASPLGYCLVLLLLVLLVVGWRLCLRLRHQRVQLRLLRQRSEAVQRQASARLGQMREELQRLAELADQVSLLNNECDTALQQQQRKLDQATAAFVQIKVESQQLADDAREVNCESRQSMRLAAKGQAGLSATLMALRSVDRAITTAQAAPNQEVRVLARQGRDQTYDANLALAGISAAASSIEERGLSISVACEAQARGVESLDAALSDVQQLAFTSAWRSRQARAASEALRGEALRLDARMRDLQEDDGGEHDGIEEIAASLPGLVERPAPPTGER